MMTPDEIIEVVTAFKACQPVQSKPITCVSVITAWADDPSPTWNFGLREYRVKFEPLELWVNLYNDGSGLAFASKRDAELHPNCRTIRTVHMREVPTTNKEGA